MDALYERGKASVAEIRGGMPDKPSYSTVRALLRILEEKGHVQHRQDGARYVYLPAISPRRAKRSALRHVVKTFFDGSPQKAVAALISDSKLAPEELDRLSRLVEEAKKKGGSQ